VKTRFAVRDPFAEGVKRSVTVQEALPAREAPQLFVCKKLEAFVPLMEMLEIVTAPLPVLLTVTIIGAEAEANCSARERHRRRIETQRRGGSGPG